MRIEIRDRQARDVRLDFLTELGDEALGGFGEDLGEGEGRDALQDSCEDDGGDQRHQQFLAMFADDVIDQVAHGSGQDHAGEAADDDEQQADGEGAFARFDDGFDVGPEGSETLGCGCGGFLRWRG